MDITTFTTGTPFAAHEMTIESVPMFCDCTECQIAVTAAGTTGRRRGWLPSPKEERERLTRRYTHRVNAGLPWEPAHRA